MHILIAGGSGQIGTLLARAFAADAHTVTILSRRSGPEGNRVVWDGVSVDALAEPIDRAHVVINLAGRSVNCRYHAANRDEILSSRVNSTRAIGQAIARAANPPAVWLQASTATIYAHRFDAPNDDFTGLLGGDEPNAPDTWRFSIVVAKAWEEAANSFSNPRTRKVLLRSAMTMSPDRGGVFDVMLGLVRRGLGGAQGDGGQYVSWIHEFDFVRAIYWLIEHDLDGAVNVCSPNPLTNREFMKVLREGAGVKFGLPTKEWMLEVGALFMQTETELVLKSRRVVPGRLMQAGFEFQYPYWRDAARDLLAGSVLRNGVRE